MVYNSEILCTIFFSTILGASNNNEENIEQIWKIGQRYYGYIDENLENVFIFIQNNAIAR